MAPTKGAAPLATSAKAGGGQKRGAKARDVKTAELEALVFGTDPLADGETAGRKLPKDKRKNKKAEGGDDAATGKDAQETTEVRGSKRKEPKPAEVVQKSAWADPDDDALEVDLMARNQTKKLRKKDNEQVVSGAEYEQRLREQFVKLHGKAQWAEQKPDLSDDEDSDEEKEIPTSAPAVQRRQTTGALKPTNIDFARRKDIPVAPGAKEGPCVITSLNFHPSSELLLTAGRDKTLRLFTVDGEENAKVSSTHFANFPIEQAAFTPDGSDVMLTGRYIKDMMWTYNVATGAASQVRVLSAQLNKKLFGLAMGPCLADHPGLQSSKLYSVLGDCGSIFVSDVSTKHVLRTLRMSAPGVAAVFSSARDTLFTADRDNNLYEWDLGSGRCLQRAKDPWATGITSLDIRGTSTYSPTPVLAVGTSSGNVDMFDLSGPKFAKEPYKSIDNLTMEINVVKFHPGGELMCAASDSKKDQLKLVHVGTGSVYMNWPTQRTPLNKVSAVDFSRKGGYMAIGNQKGKVLLYQAGRYETNDSTTA